jgi:hypothetical protein
LTASAPVFRVDDEEIAAAFAFFDTRGAGRITAEDLKVRRCRCRGVCTCVDTHQGISFGCCRESELCSVGVVECARLPCACLSAQHEHDHAAE